MVLMKSILKGLLEYRIRHRTDMVKLFRKVFLSNPNCVIDLKTREFAKSRVCLPNKTRKEKLSIEETAEPSRATYNNNSRSKQMFICPQKPQAVFYACMDTRMIPRTITKSQIGDMTIVRNPGNIIPNARNFMEEWSGSEPAALEFACIMNHIKHVIVCGHSDCRAMHALYKLKTKEESDLVKIRQSPLKTWLHAHAYPSLEQLLNMKGDYTKPMTFTGRTPEEKIVAYIDPENKFKMEDKLSQVNTIQQIQNVTSYKMLKKLLEKQRLHIHALWFEISDGDVYYFSRKSQRFIVINETSYKAILSEVNSPYSYQI